MKEGTINLQTTVVKWLWIKSTIPQCMQQPFALNVAFFERCVALPPKFRENPPIYVLNNFWKHNIPGGTCSMLFFHVSRIPCQWSSILRMYIFFYFLFIYLCFYLYIYTYLYLSTFTEKKILDQLLTFAWVSMMLYPMTVKCTWCHLASTRNRRINRLSFNDNMFFYPEIRDENSRLGQRCLAQDARIKVC